MKKIIAFALTLIMALSSLPLIISADSYTPMGGTPAGVTAEVKKTAGVVIDGIISDGEYEKLDLDLDPDNTILHMCYG